MLCGVEVVEDQEALFLNGGAVQPRDDTLRSRRGDDGRMLPVPITPRPLNRVETAVLERVLSIDFIGATQLRDQLCQAEVVALWPPESVSIDLQVPVDSPRAALPDGPAPVQADVLDASGSFTGELILWISDGRLGALEYAWVTDFMPRELPSPDQIVPGPRG